MSILIFNKNNSEKLQKGYDGNNGNKICIKQNNKHFMLKYPYIDSDIDCYNNNIFCEYIGSKIFKMLGMNAQEVFLAKCEYEEHGRLCVACEDFTFNEYDLQNFASQKNKIVESSSKGYSSELNEILDTLHKYDNIQSQDFIGAFWKMFVIDAFIGNTDRHNGNWGFLYNKKTDELKFAPIYDCESSFISTISKSFLKNIINNNYEYIDNMIENSTSSIHINGQSINYKNFITSCQNDDCNKAIIEIVPKISIELINKMIDNIEELDVEIKNLFKIFLQKRKEIILDYSYNRLITLQNEMNNDDLEL